VALLVGACGPSVQPGNYGDGGGGFEEIDAERDRPDDPDARPWTELDAGNAYPDAEGYPDGGVCDDWACTTPVTDGCGTTDVCGNGADEDCDGHPDDGCACTPGAVQECFLGPPGRRGVGSCVDGHQTCTGSGEFTQWGACTGGIRPGAEQCDGQDNDCNGCDDDNPSCCMVELACPGPGDMPDGVPYANYVIPGAGFFSGNVASWLWTVTGGPCDVLFQTTTTPLRQSFTLTGATTSTLTFRPTLSGDYTIRVVITATDGTVYECTFIVHIGGPGLRVELCSDRSANTDLDLHVHKPGTTTPWFSTTPTGFTNNPDDCFYSTCTAGDGGAANWGLATSPLANCSGGPEGPTWTALGYCRNPRLDVDSVYQNGRPENTNIDNPLNGALYRVMVAYFGGSGAVRPLVNIYCGGFLRASYGLGPDFATMTTSGGYGGGQMWRVVDAAPVVDGTGATTDCNLTALHPPATTTGYWITNNDRSY